MVYVAKSVAGIDWQRHGEYRTFGAAEVAAIQGASARVDMAGNPLRNPLVQAVVVTPENRRTPIFDGQGWLNQTYTVVAGFQGGRKVY